MTLEKMNELSNKLQDILEVLKNEPELNVDLCFKNITKPLSELRMIFIMEKDSCLFRCIDFTEGE